uniref:Putative isopropylmalate dehydrogenase-like domain-containing protein n=1 Tax=Helianthus annuus TaxID=4232 RepID=A0A251T0D4_HELAN
MFLVVSGGGDELKIQSSGEVRLVSDGSVTPNLYGNLMANIVAGIAGGTSVMPGGLLMHNSSKFWNEEGYFEESQIENLVLCVIGIILGNITKNSGISQKY